MRSAAAAKKIREFDPNTFLATIGEGRKSLAVSKNQGIFAQGDAADAVFISKKARSGSPWYPRRVEKQRSG